MLIVGAFLVLSPLRHVPPELHKTTPQLKLAVERVDAKSRKIFVSVENKSRKTVLVCGQPVAWSGYYTSPGGKRKLVTIDFSKLEAARPPLTDFVSLKRGAKFTFPTPIDDWQDIDAMIREGGTVQVELSPIRPSKQELAHIGPGRECMKVSVVSPEYRLHP